MKVNGSSFNMMKALNESAKDELEIKKQVLIESNKVIVNESTWAGVPNTKHIWNGEWSDPQVEYKGLLFNEWELQDMLNDYYEEEVEDKSKISFEDWIKENTDSVYGTLENLYPDEVAGWVLDKIDNCLTSEELNNTLNSLRSTTLIPDKIIDELLQMNDSSNYEDEEDRIYEIVPEIIEVLENKVKEGHLFESAKLTEDNEEINKLKDSLKWYENKLKNLMDLKDEPGLLSHNRTLIADYQEKIRELKAEIKEKSNITEACFDDRVKAIKKNLKKKDKRLSDKSAETSAKKIAGNMIKNEGTNPKYQAFYDELKSNDKLAKELDDLYIKVLKANNYSEDEIQEELNRGIEDKVAEVLENAAKISSEATPEMAKKLNALLDESALNEDLAKKSNIQGLEDYTEDEIKQLAKDYIYQTLLYADYNLDDFNIIDMNIYGSRNRGTAKDDSDLDIVFEYTGDFREDDLFNTLNDENDHFFIDNITVDLNPINAERSGDMESFMNRAKKYDQEVLNKTNESALNDNIKVKWSEHRDYGDFRADIIQGELEDGRQFIEYDRQVQVYKNGYNAINMLNKKANTDDEDEIEKIEQDMANNEDVITAKEEDLIVSQLYDEPIEETSMKEIRQDSADKGLLEPEAVNEEDDNYDYYKNKCQKIADFMNDLGITPDTIVDNKDVIEEQLNKYDLEMKVKIPNKVWTIGYKTEGFNELGTISYMSIGVWDFKYEPFILTPVKESATITESYGETKYEVKSYYGINFTGLEDSLDTNDYSEAENFIWDKLQKGNTVELIDTETGDRKRYSPETHEFGDETFGIEDYLVENKITEATVSKDLHEVKSQGNIYMLQDNDKYIVGENYDSKEKLIENAEIYTNKEEADKDYLNRCGIKID